MAMAGHDKWLGHDASGSTIQLLVVAEDAVLVEGNAALARQIGCDVRATGDAVVQFAKRRNFALEGFHLPRKSVTQSRHKLKYRQIDISEPAAGQKRAAAIFQQVLEIAHVFRHALVPEV